MLRCQPLFTFGVSVRGKARRKASPFRSAMSMLVFYINRAGRNIDKEQLAVLTRAKEELRRIYGRNRPQ